VRLRTRWLLEKLRTSLWLVPMGLVLGLLGLAQLLLLLDAAFEVEIRLMAGAGVAGARGMFQAVAGSMITLAGLVFSMTLVVLSQVSGQYSPRVLRNFLGDRVNQTVLGVFLGIFAYCLMVLRGLGDDADRLPVLTVVTGLGLSLLGVVFLVYFIHHVARSMQVENIVAAIQAETRPVIERLFPEDEVDDEGVGDTVPTLPDDRSGVVGCRRSGYIQDIDLDRLADEALRLDAVLHLPLQVGDFVCEGMTIVHVDGPRPDARACERIRRAFALGGSRTLQQDPGFGLRQLVDIAMKALSPGVNDTTTAVLALDRVGALLRLLCQRRMPARARAVDGRLRLVVSRPDFEDHLGLGLDQIRQWGANNPAVLGRMLDIIGDLLSVTRRPARRALLLEHARRVMAAAERAIEEDCDLAWLRERFRRLPEAGLSP